MWAIPFLICGVLVAVGAWRLRGSGPEAWPSPPNGLTAHDLSLYDLAYLSGGAPRMVVTALVAMRLEGRLIVSRSGTVTVTDPAPVNEVEAAIIAALGESRRQKLNAMGRPVLRGRAVRAIGDRLARQGLLTPAETPGPDPALANVREFHGWMLVVALVVGVVTVPLATATGDGGPWALLAFVLLLALGAVPLIGFRLHRPERPTRAGRAWRASLNENASWSPDGLGLDARTVGSLRLFALCRANEVPGLEDAEVRLLIDEFGTRRRLERAARTAVGTAATGSAGVAGASAVGCGCGTGHGDGGGHHGGGHSGCGGCGGGCGCGCGG
ncbi:TIGR04222 domain-containing membrane protein [Streptomyces sp. NPDC052396]|uniref:TIGR04222 domain-containing membrane protein n=1 Tax=Streptomyces sp. NPDC052396 TaxID=3365689 RepID=UPI0037D90E28